MQEETNGLDFHTPGTDYCVMHIRGLIITMFQVEVDQWEDKVRALKDELLQLESQKKGLEAVLRRHQGPCKVHKSEMNENQLISLIG